MEYNYVQKWTSLIKEYYDLQNWSCNLQKWTSLIKEYYDLQNWPSLLKEYCDFKITNNVSITIAFLLAITAIFIVYNACTLLKRKQPKISHHGHESYEDLTPGTDSEDEFIRWKKECTDVKAAASDIIHDIHYTAARVNQRMYEKRCLALLQKCPEAINIPNPKLMFTPFLRACFCGNANVVGYMLKNGANIKLCTKEGASPMFLAVYCATKTPKVFDPACIELLYNAGCDINKPKSHGYTPLHLAAKSGHVRLVRWLLSHGADPDSVTKCNKKPVDFASGRGHRRVVNLLTVRYRSHHMEKRSSSTSPRRSKLNKIWNPSTNSNM